MVIVTPGIHKGILANRNTIDHRTEDHITILHQDRLTDAVVMIRALHIVVGPKGEAHLSPGRKRL